MALVAVAAATTSEAKIREGILAALRRFAPRAPLSKYCPFSAPRFALCRSHDIQIIPHYSWENVIRIKYQNFYLKASHHIATGVQSLSSDGIHAPVSPSEHVYIAEVGLKAYELLRAVR